MLSTQLKRHYADRRRTIATAGGYALARHGFHAVESLAAARRYIQRAAARIIHSDSPIWAGHGGGWNLGQAWAIGSDTIRTAERPQDIGLRFVGFSDEILPQDRDSHQGWYLDYSGQSGEVARGSVYLFPARMGKVRAVAAVADPFNDGPAMLALFDVEESDPGESSWDTSEAVLQAARNADSIAKRYAQDEREYRAAWGAGARHAAAGEEAQALRAEFLVVRLEARLEAQGMAKTRSTLCQVIRGHLADLAAQVEALRQERADLVDGGDNGPEWCRWWPGDARQAEAFADGAGV